MALSLNLTVTGTVTPDVVRVLVNGVQATLTGATWSAEVPLASGIVAVTSISAAGTESVRTMQVAVTPGAAV